MIAMSNWDDSGKGAPPTRRPVITGRHGDWTRTLTARGHSPSNPSLRNPTQHLTLAEQKETRLDADHATTRRSGAEADLGEGGTYPSGRSPLSARRYCQIGRAHV